MTFRNKVTAGFGTAIAILILVGVLSYRSLVQSDVDREWVTHTHLVIERLDIVENNLLDIESSQRGYILTVETFFLDSYTVDSGGFRHNVKEVRELTAEEVEKLRRATRAKPADAAFRKPKRETPPSINAWSKESSGRKSTPSKGGRRPVRTAARPSRPR